MNENPLLKLKAFGQSIWMDYIQRSVITSGQLKQLIDEDGLCGVTSNPSIFEKAIAESSDYEESIRALALSGKKAQEIYEAITVEDIRMAADVFRPTYDRLEGRDGFVSLEVNPHLAYDTQGTIAEARRLWSELQRPNVFIKVPATQESLPAIKQLISEGINVNVTLLFGLLRYREVAEAYIAGLEERAVNGRPISNVASVASFFLSRIDVLVDPLLEKIAAASSAMAEIAGALRGQAAIASAKLAYSIYKEIFSGERFSVLRTRDARTQRVLWASTSTKNPEYADVKYVEPLIGPHTINTLPPETIKAYRDHGNPAPRLEDIDTSRVALGHLAQLGIDINVVTEQLEKEGVEKFIKPYDKLLNALEARRLALLAGLDKTA
jgi:transaldolase